MKPHVLIRPGDMPPAKVRKFKAVAEGLGFRVTIQSKVGRTPVVERPGFERDFQEIRRDIVAGKLSIRQGARKLGVGSATLHRLLHNDERPQDGHATSTFPVS